MQRRKFFTAMVDGAAVVACAPFEKKQERVNQKPYYYEVDIKPEYLHDGCWEIDWDGIRSAIQKYERGEEGVLMVVGVTIKRVPF